MGDKATGGTAVCGGGTLPLVGGAGGGSFGDRIPAWVGDRRESRARQRPSVPMVVTSRRRERRRKGSRRCPWLNTLSPIPVSGSCRSVFVGTILSSFYDYGFGCVFCKIYTLNVVCEVMHWDGGFMKQE